MTTTADIKREYGGSDIPAAEAASLHKLWTAKLPAGSTVRIGSPAVARGAVGQHAYMEVSLVQETAATHRRQTQG